MVKVLPVSAGVARPRNTKLVGKAAFERTLDIVFTALLCRIFQHALMEFNTDFIDNIFSQIVKAGKE